jgi:acyl carrier protein
MHSIEDFVSLIQDELGLAITADNVGRAFDEIPGWDSAHLLRLLTVLERETGRQISLPQILQAPSLEHIFGLAAAGV